MVTNTNRLILLIRFIDAALLLIVATMIYNVVDTLPYFNRFSTLANRLPSSDKFTEIKNFFSVITFLTLIKLVVFRGLFGVVLLQIRAVIKSMLRDGVFSEMQAKKIRKIAFLYLIIASILLFLNFIFMLAAFNKGHERLFLGSIDQFFGILENYVISALIAFGIAEVFKSGMVLKEEKELTI